MFFVIILMCCGNFLNADEGDDRLYLSLKKIVENMPSKHNVTDRGYLRNSLRLAMVTPVNYENFYIRPKEYFTVKKIFKNKKISNILILLVVENFERKGMLYYGFLQENEDLHEASKKILASENASYKIELKPEDRAEDKVNLLSENTYLIRLSYPDGASTNEGFGGATFALTGMNTEISIIKVGIANWLIPPQKCGINPDMLAWLLYDYVIDDFIKRNK